MVPRQPGKRTVLSIPESRGSEVGVVGRAWRHVVFITHTSVAYGANRSMIDLAEALAIEGFRTTVILPDRGTICFELDRMGIAWRIVRFRPWIQSGPLPRWKSAAASVVNRVAEWRIHRVLLADRPDVLHLNSLCVGVGFSSARSLGIPVVWHAREYLEEDYGLSFQYPDRALAEISRSDAVVAISKDIQRKFEPLLGRPMDLVYNGIPLSGSREVPAWPRSRGILKIAIVGVLVEGKGHDDIFRAIALLLDSGMAVELAVIGDGPRRLELQTLATKLGIGDHVQFTGYVSDVRDRLASVDVCVVASRREAFGRVTVEAMSEGVVVVGASTGGTAELVEEGDTGRLYLPGDSTVLANILREITEDPDRHAMMAERARQDCSRRFSICRVAREIHEIYQRVGVLPEVCRD